MSKVNKSYCYRVLPVFVNWVIFFCLGNSSLAAGGFKIFNNTKLCLLKQPYTLSSMSLAPVIRNTGERCNGDSIGSSTVVSVGGGTPPYTYYWTPSGQTSQTVTGLSAGVYSVLVTDANGQTGTASATILQPPPIIVSFNADSIQSCGQICTDFSDLSWDASSNLNKWSWNFGDGGTSALQNPRHCFTGPGKYNITLIVRDVLGCSAQLTITDMINVYGYPHAAFTMNPQLATLSNPDIQFTDKSTDQYGIGAWVWNFNDTSELSNLQNPYHTYKDSGTYCIKLKITSVNGCADSITNCLHIYPPFNLWIPDAFSPNGDRLNDVFLPKGASIKIYNMYIFNRWGELLFHSNSLNNGWNGCYGGSASLCQTDTYIYVINATDYGNITHNYMGKLILLH